MGAVAFQKGLGAMHALAHSIGGLLDSHHGLTIAIVMPYVLSANRAAISRRRWSGSAARSISPSRATMACCRGSWSCGAGCRSRRPWRRSACGRSTSRCWRRAPPRIPAPRPIPLPLDAPAYGALSAARARKGSSRPEAPSAATAAVTAIGGATNYVIGARFVSRRADRRAGVAELVDARDLGPRGCTAVGVRVPSPAPKSPIRVYRVRRVATEMPGGARCRSPSCRPRA